MELDRLAIRRLVRNAQNRVARHDSNARLPKNSLVGNGSAGGLLVDVAVLGSDTGKDVLRDEIAGLVAARPQKMAHKPDGENDGEAYGRGKQVGHVWGTPRREGTGTSVAPRDRLAVMYFCRRIWTK